MCREASIIAVERVISIKDPLDQQDYVPPSRKPSLEAASEVPAEKSTEAPEDVPN